MRDDKPAGSIVREESTSMASSGPAIVVAPSVKVSNPDRVIDASTGLKKVDLVRYYESVADWSCRT